MRATGHSVGMVRRPPRSCPPPRRLRLGFAIAGALSFLACSDPVAPPRAPSGRAHASGDGEHAESGEGTRLAEDPTPPLRAAVFAGGCFWCMEGPLEAVPGVGEVFSGYTGGALEHVTYQQIGRGNTGHVEAVRVIYDPAQVTYARLLEVFVRNIDPTQDDGQFCDRGTQYRSAIFVASDEERAAAQAALRAAAEALGRTVVTEVREAGPFWLAEDYHQDFYRTHRAHYERYRLGCGRDARLRELWGEAASGHAP